MSTHEDRPQHVPGQSPDETREQVLPRGKPFPLHEEMAIDGLTDDEEEKFLAAIADA